MCCEYYITFIHFHLQLPLRFLTFKMGCIYFCTVIKLHFIENVKEYSYINFYAYNNECELNAHSPVTCTICLN